MYRMLVVNGSPLILFGDDVQGARSFLQTIALRLANKKETKSTHAVTEAVEVRRFDKTRSVFTLAPYEPPTEDTEKPDEYEKALLTSMVPNTRLSDDQKESIIDLINSCESYVLYDNIRHRLEDAQLSIDEIPNPSQTDITKHLKNMI